MAYDNDLANRIREAIAEEIDVTEKAMFGGLAFLVGGHMSVAVSGQGGSWYASRRRSPPPPSSWPTHG